MAGDAARKSRWKMSYGTNVFLPEDLAIGILLSLPSGSAIARCRCVCRSWRSLLSDPNFVRKIISFKTPDVQKSLRILLTGAGASYSLWNYSIRSYETLDPIPQSGNFSDDLPSQLPIRYIHGSSKIVGCSDGIFCIVDRSKGYHTKASRIVLWNPATSEAKFIPSHCPLHPLRDPSGCGLSFESEHVGFGFDPQTKDYKVVQVLRSRGHRSYSDIVFTEVYSLRNDSWKPVPVSQDPFQGRSETETLYVHQQLDTSRNDKCYWFSLEFGNKKQRKKRRLCDVISFDMTTEEFSSVRVRGPGGLDRRNAWFIKSCFMSKGVFVATFVRQNDFRVNVRGFAETWALLKCGIGKSWIKLFTLEPPLEAPFCNVLDLWKDGMYICSYSGVNTGLHKVFSFEPATNEIIRDGLEIEGTYEFQAHTFVPTRVPLISACCGSKV